jgi:diguanylate cyclase (GGDEF)-like protein/PAS domain S-box-containing protein
MGRATSSTKQKFVNKTIFVFIALGIFAWVVDSFVDAAFFYGNSLPEQMFAANGENLWSRLFILSIFVGFGSYAGLIISRGKTAEEDAKQARAFAETVFNSMHDAISVLDATTFKIIDVNSVFLDEIGLGKEEVIGKTCYEVTHRQTLPCAPPNDTCPLYDTVKSGAYAAYEHVHRGPCGEKIFVEVSTNPITDSQGKVVQVVHVSKNITERKRMEEEMQKLSMVVNKTADMVVITSKGGIIEYVNPAFEEMTGYSREEAVGNTPRILKSGEHGLQFYENLWATILAGNTYRGVFVNRKKSGELYYDSCTITPVINSKGAITNFIATAKDITEQKLAEQELRERAEKDYLTGIYNRRAFFEILESEVERARRYNRPLSVVMLDIDHFKKINDTYGHAVGDEVLKATTEVLQRSVRLSDVLARIGGEEFVILVPETSLDHTLELAGKVRRSIESSALLPHGAKVTISFGIAELDENVSIDELMRRADEALYLAKSNGRNRVEHYRDTVSARDGLCA